MKKYIEKKCLLCDKLIFVPQAFKFCKSCSKMGGRDRVRELIRIRDDHTCQICGKIWTCGRRFDVHHKDGDKEKTHQVDDYEKEKDNMMTLCHKCHGVLHLYGIAGKKGRIVKGSLRSLVNEFVRTLMVNS